MARRISAKWPPLRLRELRWRRAPATGERSAQACLTLGWTLLIGSFVAAALYQGSGLNFTPRYERAAATGVPRELYLALMAAGCVLTTCAMLTASRRAPQGDRSTTTRVVVGLVAVVGVVAMGLWGFQLAVAGLRLSGGA